MGAMTRVTWRGKRFNRRTVQMLTEVERRMGRPLSYMQGSYNSSVGASAGTHDGGGAVDCWADLPSADRLVLTLRRCGFAAAWHRTPQQGPWGHHVHAIASDDPERSSGARSQTVSVLAGRNGLANQGRDDGPRLDPWPSWQYVEEESRTTIFGIDISHHQGGAFPFKRCYVDGIRFAYLKATEGTTFRDPRFRENLRASRAANLFVAAYHYMSSSNPAAQARNCAQHIGDTRVPVIIDLEPSGASKPTLGQAREFAAALKARGYRVTMLYFPPWYWEQVGRPNLSDSWPTIASRYGQDNMAHYRVLYPGDQSSRWAAYGARTPTILQYGQRGRVAGVAPLDVNAYRGKLTDLARWFQPPAGTDVPEDELPSIDELRTLIREELASEREKTAAAVLASQVDMKPGKGENLVSVEEVLRYTHNSLARMQKAPAPVERPKG
jgi:GH25 family lysozyme M1 (1,4-beta-N-acetylmuramidase)